MKKLIIAGISLIILAAAALIVYQNLPEKRYARHMIKARLYQQQNNLVAAKKEYEAAFAAKGGYTPYVSLEVLRFENNLALKDKNISGAINNTRKYLELHPKDSEAAILLANLAFEAGELGLAFSTVNSILVQNPVSFPARLLLAKVRTSQGRLDLAEEQIRVLVEAHPDSLLALMPIASNLLKQGRISEARDYLQKVLKLYPDNPVAKLNLIDSYLMERKPDSARIILQAWAVTDSSKTQAVRIRLARLFSLMNQFDSAEIALSDYRFPNQNNFEALGELALVKTKQGQYDSAIKVYSSMIETAPSASPKAKEYINLLHLANSNPARALEVLKELSIGANDLILPMNQIMTYLALDQEHKAIEVIQRGDSSMQKQLTEFMANLIPTREFVGQWALLNYYRLNNQSFNSLQTIAQMYLKYPENALVADFYSKALHGLGQAPLALEVLEKLKQPTLAQKVNKVTLYVTLGKLDKAMDLCQKILKEEPKLIGIHTLLADLNRKKGNSKAYVEHLQAELELNPNNVVALNNLAWEFGVEQKDMQAAAPYLTKLEAQKQGDPRIMDTMGWILAINGKLKEAKPYFILALNLVPDSPTLLYHMANVEKQLGETDSAKRHLQKALDSKRNFEERKLAETMLAEMN